MANFDNTAATEFSSIGLIVKWLEKKEAKGSLVALQHDCFCKQVILISFPR